MLPLEDGAISVEELGTFDEPQSVEKLTISKKQRKHQSTTIINSNNKKLKRWKL